MANGSNPWDQNTDQYGYPTIDQVGRGVCRDQIRGYPPINQRTGGRAWPRQQLEPVYVWGNDWTPVPNNPGALIVSNQAVIQIGRDMINNGVTPMPGYTPYTYPHPLVTGQPTPPPTPTHDAYSYTNRDRYANADCDSHVHANANGYIYSESNSNAYRDRYSNCHTHADFSAPSAPSSSHRL
jgi:hypothetical protein